MFRYMLFAAALGLAACATPAERCIANATDDLSALDAEISETEANIARGYRFDDSVTVNVGATFCTGSGNVSLCLEGDKDLPKRKIPINVNTERAKLASLKRERASRVERMELELAACQSLS